jgi:hypothetical protein
MPAWGVVLAEGIALVILGMTGWHIAQPKYRPRIPVGIVVIAALVGVQAAVQERTWRVAAWIVILVSLTFAITALGKRGRIFADYQATRATHGDRSKEVTVSTWKLIGRMLVIAAVLMGLSALLIKGAYSQGS